MATSLDIISKRIEKFACLSINFLLSFISGIAIYVNFGKLWSEQFHNSDIFIGHHFGLLLHIWPINEGIIFIVAVLGIFAALSEKKTLIRRYGMINFFAFLLNAIIGGTMVTTAFLGLSNINPKFHELMTSYNNNLDSQAIIDSIQEDMKCCGLEGPSDWLDSIGLRPSSCCADMLCISSYPTGCGKQIYYYILPFTALILTVSSLMSILLLLALVTALCLQNKFKKANEVLRV